MSKKLAGGADGLVLDVKCGSGAFMKSFEQAELLAKSLVQVGKLNGLKVKALITKMDEPLGDSIGNSLEVQESIEILQGKKQNSILAQLSYRISAEMLVLGGIVKSMEEGLKAVNQVVHNGKALEKYKEWVEFNGGNGNIFTDFSLLPQPGKIYNIIAKQNQVGYISAMDSRKLGIFAMQLGAGRKTKDDILDLGVGVKLMKQVGNQVKAGEVLMQVYAKKELNQEIEPDDGWLTLVENQAQVPKTLHDGADYWLLGQVE
jgi:pyrimidine-nucleoside phosphorylase